MGAATDLTDPVKTRHDDGVLVVTIDNPPVNATGAAVRAGLMAALDQARTDALVAAVVITGAGKTFIGGADIREFGKPPVDPALPAVIAAIEAFDKPVVAAINGAALGGGLEVALACHGRVAGQTASLGLPEVHLGLVPGAGGTQRLPRLVGTLVALKMITDGKPVGASQALETGLVDRMADADLLAAATGFARSLVAQPLRRTGQLTVRPHDAGAFEAEAERVAKKARGRSAPLEGIRLVRMATESDLDTGLKAERETFVRLRDSTESAALRHIFFAERSAGKPPELKAVEPRRLETIGIAGTGLMGCGIAVATLAAGYRVIALDQTAEAAEKGAVRIRETIAKSVASGRLSQESADTQLSRLTVTADANLLSAADLVIEAVFDDLQVKTDLFQRLDGIVPETTILATNTSYLDPDEIAAATAHPSRVVGLHFFSPAHIMKLVEVVRCASTAPEVLATALAFARTCRKIPVVTGVCEGFIGNRIFSAYRDEAERLIEEGALPQDVDRAMEAYGFPMGLFAVYDMAGLEIAWARRKRQAATRDPNLAYFEIPDRLCEAGRFGRKAGRGFYLYEDGRKKVDPEIDRLIADYRAEKGFIARAIGDDEIIARLLARMAREGQALLDETIAARAEDIDVVLVHGYGFPAHKGGPMFAAPQQLKTTT
ncbi:3-hydroxyacyl-CoA dehydrogenase NAD-binding domain-containing protein [Rhizobium halophytocola]|uniref:3-hydroxyacyl-CoA dehydrogenase n=1 Tax=Rhizobium halophytocola TaxID=735519 RepID=A0ABS4DV97_9HYPH|nr:3-hydroxyacyl-CoA dehydrogenase NAD-binding domain-containing protein [Rhizobium halophytocola]MBP1849616.1 3-hydroxyacyl-CoA dehydrogenase [Rhizobium halophytocola]